MKDLNKQRKKQARQIDILCNDFISSQKDFIRKLNIIHFTADFYETILGDTELSSLLNETVTIIKGQVGIANITFFLRQEDNFELHIFEESKPAGTDVYNLENYFSPELMDSICKANKICSLEDMLSMGLQGSPTGLGKLTAVTLPLGILGSSLGFILLYRSCEQQFQSRDITNLLAIRTGLSRAVSTCQKLANPAG